MGKKPKAVKPQPLQLYNEQCSICLEDLDSACECLECGHSYHSDCILNLYKNKILTDCYYQIYYTSTICYI